MALIAYLDETGDHAMWPLDTTFPIFALAMFVCDTAAYIHTIVPAVYQFKFDYFGHEGVIIHSRDIRKAQGDFAFLTDPSKRPAFYERINRIMTDSDYTLLAAVIDKKAHLHRYGSYAYHPYDLALTFALERFVGLLEDVGQNEITIIAESRGQREDEDLRLRFGAVLGHGTQYVTAAQFAQIRFNLVFKPKQLNIIGTQLADLAAYPIARHILNPAQPNLSFDVLQPKLYKRRGQTLGLKIFP